MWMRSPRSKNDIAKDEPSPPEGGLRAFRSHTYTAYTPNGEFFRASGGDGRDGNAFRGPGSAGDGREGGNRNGFRSGGHRDSPAGTPNTEQSSFLAPHAHAQSHSAGRGESFRGGPPPFSTGAHPFPSNTLLRHPPTQFPPQAAPFQPSPFLPAAAPASPQATVRRASRRSQRSSPPQPFVPPPDTVSPAPVQAGHTPPKLTYPSASLHRRLGLGRFMGRSPRHRPRQTRHRLRYRRRLPVLVPPARTALQRRVRWQREPAQAHAQRPGWAVWRAYRPRRVRVRR
ncbi:hypothetical protein C8R45DRAFT_1011507 [Mycena sanguinolenta]|nr:hypothetical protein C8R45DRAFT_1011507 [Mycena sanguinolenta]